MTAMDADAPRLCMIVAVAENAVIGHQGQMPWRIRSELKHFRASTMGKPVIMGRKTFVSLGKPLDGRDNIVITRRPDQLPQGAIAVGSVEQALRNATDCAAARSADEIMIIGGAEIYHLMLPMAQRIYYTLIHGKPDGDTYFPELKQEDWRETSRSPHSAQKGDDYGYTVIIYDRIT